MAFLILGSNKFVFLVLDQPRTMTRLAILTQVIRGFPQPFCHLQQQRLKLVLNRVLTNTLTLIILPSHGAVKNHKEKRMTTKYTAISRYVCATTAAFKKTVRIAYSECVFVTLVVHNAKCMRRIILASVASPGLQHFPVLSHKRHDFRGGGGGATEYEMCLYCCTVYFVE